MDLDIPVLVKEFISLTDEGLRQLETQNGRIEPIEVRARVFRTLDQSVEKLVLFAILVAENELLGSLVQH
jgi:hypothetical protein